MTISPLSRSTLPGAVLGASAPPTPGILHLGDPEPVRIYATTGDITGMTLYSPKAAQITSGNDIADVNRFIKQFEQSQKMMKQMPGMMKKKHGGMFGGMGGGFPFG